MKDIGIEGVVRGKKPKTTIPDKALPCRLDKVNRQFHAPTPNVFWVSDCTSVATWQGFVYVAFVIDVFARRIVGWRVSHTATAGFVLDALEQCDSSTQTRSTQTGASLGLRVAIFVDQVYRALGRGEDRPVGRQRRLQLRQRSGRNDQWAV